MATVKIKKVVEVEESIALALVRGMLPPRTLHLGRGEMDTAPVVCFREKSELQPGGEAWVVSGAEKVIALTEAALEAAGQKRIEILKRLTDAEAAKFTKAA